MLDSVQIPMGSTNSGDRAVNYRTFCHELCKMAEPIDLSFGLWTRVGRRKHKFNRIRQVSSMCPHGRTHFYPLPNTIEPSSAAAMRFMSLVIFGHAHLDSRTDSRAVRAEYCIVGIPHNTAIYFIY